MSRKLKLLTYAGSTVFSRGLAQLLANKLISASFGPSGLGIYGIWQNFSQIFASLSNGSTQNGIIVSIAKTSKEKGIKEIIGGALSITLLFSLTSSTLLMIFFPFIRTILTDSVSIFNVVLFSLCLPLIGWSICLTSIQNGLQSTSDQLITNIIVPTFYLFFIFISTQISNLNLAMASFTLSQVTPLFVLIFFLKKKLGYWPVAKPKWTNLNWTLLKHSTMSLAFTASFPLATFIIRERLVFNLSLNHAGFYDSILKISAISSALISSIVSIYFLPQLSTTNHDKIMPIYFRIYRLLAFVYLLGIGVAYFASDFIIGMLYSKEFLIVSKVLWIQLIGDFLKNICFLNMNFFVSRNSVKTFVLLEMSAAILYLLFCSFHQFASIESIIFSYLSAYSIYAILSYTFLKLRIRGNYEHKTT